MRYWMLSAALLLAAPAVRAEDEHPSREAVDEAEEKQVLDFVGGNEPEMRRHLENLKRNEPGEYGRRIGEMARMNRDPEIREHFMARAKAHRKVRELAQAYRKADEKGKPAAKQALRGALAELFEADLAQKELHLKMMQAQIGKLKERIAKRRTLKDKVIDKRLERMTSDEDDDWED